MVRISVIIPVHNVERYLGQCLDSVMSQGFEDIEIICVNDGSTDASLEILERYQANDSRIKIIDQENMGAGASRNIALDNAQGEYIYFTDSDDYLEEGALERMYGVACDSDADFIMFKVRNFNDDTGEIIDDEYYSMPYLKERVGDAPFNYGDVSDMALDLSVCPYASFFKNEFIKDIRFPEGLLFEDNVFFTHALFKADKVVFLDEFLYNRRQRIDSASNRFTVKSLDTIEITNMLLDLCAEYNHPRHKGELYYRIFHNIYNLFKKADSSQKEEFFEKIRYDYLKNKDRWENDDYFKDKLKDEYMHMFNCAIKSRNAARFERCVDGFKIGSRLERLRNKLL